MARDNQPENYPSNFLLPTVANTHDTTTTNGSDRAIRVVRRLWTWPAHDRSAGENIKTLPRALVSETGDKCIVCPLRDDLARVLRCRLLVR